MRFDTSQQMQLGQQMKLGPRMIQSMEILQMPMLELQERIEQELEGNVALEQVEPNADINDVGEAPEVDTSERLESREMTVDGEGGASDDFERLSVLESSYKDAFDNQYSSSQYKAGERDRKLDAMANLAARGKSLADQLLDQWTFADVDDDTAQLGRLIIGYIGADGLLTTDFETIAEQNAHLPDLDITVPRLEAALERMHYTLEPPGVAARSRQECFLLQIDALEMRDDDPDHHWDDVRLLITEHFDDLLQNRLPRIAASTELPLARIQAAIDLMRRLNLSPGKDLADAEVMPIIPDVIVEYDERADMYVARLATGVLPALTVSDRYRSLGRDKAQPKETREFVNDSVRRAQWLIDSIDQRKGTLLRVVGVVLARQREYFDRGQQALKPLPMIEVADQLGIHVGTVSRAVRDKWLQTPRGLVALRSFFSGGTQNDSGRDMSWDAVKATLREIVDAEDKTKPMSDEALARALKERGIEIARRTVVKYRQQLDIPPARRRKIYE